WKCLPSLKRCISYSENRVAPVSGCAVRVSVGLVIFMPIYDRLNTSDGDQHPIGTVVQFVIEFVNCFLQDVCLHQHPQISFVLGNETSAFYVVEIALEIKSAHMVIPEICPFQQVGFLPLGIELILHHRAVYGIMEGTDHSCHIP